MRVCALGGGGGGAERGVVVVATVRPRGQWRAAHLPVRPKPVAMQSRMRSTPCLAAAGWTAATRLWGGLGPGRHQDGEASQEAFSDQPPVLVAQLAHAPQVGGRVQAHPARALHDRLDDHRGHLLSVRLEQRAELRSVRLDARRALALAERGGEARREEVRREHAAEHLGVHAVDWVAHAHRAEGVAVVPAAHRQHARAPLHAPRPPELQRHLERHLDRHRAGVAQEDPLQRRRRHLGQPLAQLDRRPVRQPAEHHVRHSRHLVCHGCVQLGHRVPVHRRPPRRHAVDQLPTVLKGQRHAGGALDCVARCWVGGARVGVPEPPLVGRDEPLGRSGVAAARRRLSEWRSRGGEARRQPWCGAGRSMGSPCPHHSWLW